MSVEENKEADPSLVDVDNVTKMANPHGDMGHGGNTQAVFQSQHNAMDTTEDWDVGVLNHVLSQVLDKDAMDADVTNKFSIHCNLHQPRVLHCVR